MNKISKVYMGVAMITSVLIFLFGLYFSTKGIVEVMYESWRAIGVSCLAFLLTLFSMMKLPFKIKKGIIALELILMIAVFGPMIIKGTILNFQSFPFGVIVDLTIVFTVLLMILLGLSTRRIYPDKESTIDSIFINLQIIMMFHTFYDHFSFGIEVMDHASALQIGQVVRSAFLGTMNLQMLWIFFGILIVFGSILKMFSDTFRGKNMKDSIMSVSK
ncbi:hypothetical protein [Granulicatella elegans]|jgi:hypothetical protein|uniref:hypothetical protein n=1 Tax=Granulicatella elegans TaxID=137732 RepID=UPI0028D3A2FF|nr:hypothetical protein [Granulicatella elegans]